ncbi:MAG: [Fe-Fe] hydrogenase large subunit C-terminal domain-containing protein [Spirochaetota bacterium]
MKPAIHTEKTECRDCYKCVRECPVKAIRVKDSSAIIDRDRCIFCGRCVYICPAKAKRVRNDIPRAKQLLKLKQRVFVSLAPSFPVYFSQPPQRLIGQFLSLGFEGVSETAIGADIVTDLQNRHFAGTLKRPESKIPETLLEDEAAVLFSSACPPVVELIRKYYPHMTEHLSPFHSPMMAHGRMLRRNYGKDIGIVFVGPCIAKKHEADQFPDIIDVALTFEEAAEWLAETDPAHPEPSSSSQSLAFVPQGARSARFYPIEGGMKTAMEQSSGTALQQVFVQSGIHAIQSSLASYSGYSGNARSFCELLACSGGCIDGCGFASAVPLAERHRRIIEFAAGQHHSSTESVLSAEAADLRGSALDEYYRAYTKAPAADRPRYTEKEIQSALQRLEKSNSEDLKDCGGCGYNTCRDFAAAWLGGMAEKEMCVTEMRKLAQRKANALIHKIPLGIALIDSDWKIVECNGRFLSLFCDFEEEPSEEVITRTFGSSVDNFLKEPELLRSAFTARQSREQILRTSDKVLEAHCFCIQPDRLIGITLHDITTSSVKRSMVVKKAQEVIRKNLSSVQQIAGLLGENAAETEILLNQLIETFDPEDVPRGGRQ